MAYFLYSSANTAEINNKKASQYFSFLHRSKYRATNPSTHQISFYFPILSMIEATTIYVEKLENGILIVKNVPCKKCSQCGEEFFSMAIMKEIEKLSKQAEKIISEVMIIDYNKAA